jgi:hypothetical protein
MKNKGMHRYRFKDNPLERAFAKEWDDFNKSYVSGNLDGRGVLDYLLAEDPNNPQGEVTARDRVVAATVIQWLGSPCGQAFLERLK